MFFVIACVALWLGFLTKMVLITHQCLVLLSSAYTTSIPSRDILAVSRVEARRSCEGQLTPTDRRLYSITYEIVPSIKSWRKEAGRGYVQSDAIPSSCSYIQWSPAFLAMAEHSWWEGVKELLVLFCSHAQCGGLILPGHNVATTAAVYLPLLNWTGQRKPCGSL